MIHRDVSPSNVMLSYEGAVKLLDFGIAKALGGEGVEEGTQKGTLKGKFAYMAPEQTRGTDVDHRIDIFATGIVLHEILTGRRLFKGDNDLQTVERVRAGEVPPPSLQNPLCPPELDQFVLQALAPNADHRFQSAGEMAEALDDIVHVTRFQPTHLAGLMRDLFPGDAPADSRANNTGSVRISQSMPSSSSRPLSLTTRSPTVPPVTVTSGSVSSSSVPSPLADSFQAEKPLLKRTGFVLGMFVVLLVGGIGGGVWFARQDSTGQADKGNNNKSGPIKIRVDSIPDGAQVALKGSDEPLCETPCKATIDWNPDEPTRLILRKRGFEDMEKLVRPPLAVFASLRKGRSTLGQKKGRHIKMLPEDDPPKSAAQHDEAQTDEKTPKRSRSSGRKSKRSGSGGTDIVDPFR